MSKLKSNLIAVFCITALIGIACSSEESDSRQNEAVDFVNPYMGNISHLLVPTFPTIHLPNSLLRVYPQRRDFTETELFGLPLVVTSHRGSSAFNLSPYQGSEGELNSVIQYSYDLENLTPYSYSVYLDELQINVDYGISHQSAAYELQFEKNAAPYLIVNSEEGELSWNGEAISGYQLLQNNTRVYLYLLPEDLPQVITVLEEGVLGEGNAAKGRNATLVAKYPEGTKKLNLKYGISFIDEDQARKNMEREVSGKSVSEIQSMGRDIWNKALGKIKVDGGSMDDRFVFYTSLYRCYERPVCISEDGRYYSAFDGAIHNDEGRPFYTDDWIWDSYRAHHPLRTIIDIKKEEDILNSFVLMAEQMDNFWLPTFPEITGDSRRMNSNHGVASVIDAYRKGLGNFDLEKAYEAAKGAITEKTLAPWSGKPAGELDLFYKENGYIPALYEGEEETIPEVHSFERRQPVAVTLGTSYDQWCLAQIANELGKTDEAEFFTKSSFNYRNLFNRETHFFHPKDNEGNFIMPFDYKFSGGMGARGFYGENNAWIYRWDVQHNIPDLINLMGGNENFVNNLDVMFKEPLGMGKYHFYAQLPDHTGNVGQFSMANEPSLHIPYLYNYAGQPWKTQKSLRKLINEWFRSDLMGVPGDEDGGGMSSFVVFSSLGFYPVTPGLPIYSIGTPFFEYSAIDLGNGVIFEIEAEGASSENKYIQAASLNGEEIEGPWILHEDIIKGGKLIFEMGPKANKSWGTNPERYTLMLDSLSN
ncbi:MAG: glycoside hydrolase family 92 protein [Bacteroidales bacterium]|nr:glycoside hydrolase family 92 protein [Bacteroidales bacterium]